MKLGKLVFTPISEAPELVAKPIREWINNGQLAEGVFVTHIDPGNSDTDSFCANYDISTDIATNCIVVEAKRADRVWHAACLIRAEDTIDVNGKVRRFLNARRVSFAPRDIALELTNMEYGSIAPVGLPSDWQVLIDKNILANTKVVMGGGLRISKILIETNVLKNLPGFIVMDIAR